MALFEDPLYMISVSSMYSSGAHVCWFLAGERERSPSLTGRRVAGSCGGAGAGHPDLRDRAPRRSGYAFPSHSKTSASHAESYRQPCALASFVLAEAQGRVPLAKGRR